MAARTRTRPASFVSPAFSWPSPTGAGSRAKALSRRGADPNLTPPDGKTPLMYAAESGDVGIIDALLDAKARPNAVSAEGESALALAVSSGHFAAALQLVNRGVNPKLKLKEGKTAPEVDLAELLPFSNGSSAESGADQSLARSRRSPPSPPSSPNRNVLNVRPPECKAGVTYPSRLLPDPGFIRV